MNIQSSMAIVLLNKMKRYRKKMNPFLKKYNQREMFENGSISPTN